MHQYQQQPLRILIIGAGYVGLTTGVCLAYLGYRVTCVDKNEKTVARLKLGQVTIHEPGLEALLSRARDNIVFTSQLTGLVNTADIIIIAVGTPSRDNGDADLSSVEQVAVEIGEGLDGSTRPLVVNKSTVPVGSARRVETVIKAQLERRGSQCDFLVASNPEFLREGAAISNTFYPDRLVVGARDPAAVAILQQLYAPILAQSFVPPAGHPRPAGYTRPPFIATDWASAELIKYAANCFLALKISFINEFAGLAEKTGANIQDVAQGMGLDNRIGPKYLQAGIGWGGSCLGKDTRAAMHTAAQYGYNLAIVQAAVEVNQRRRMCVIEKLQELLKVIRGNMVGILGLAFKPHTNDLREAPALEIIQKLLELGARVKVYDPVAMPVMQREYPDLEVEYTTGVAELCRGCDALVLTTEWPQWNQVQWGDMAATMARPIFIDGRNMFSPAQMEKAGFIYRGVGV